jgi:putative ABC transport system permease protein
MQSTMPDVRYSIRALLRDPGFTAVAVLTLALGVGANASIFSVARTVLLKPLPFPAPERLVEVWESRVDRGWTHSSFTYANFWDVRDMNRSLSSMGALAWSTANLTGSGTPERLSAGQVTTGFFGALGVTPVAGRLFAEGEDRAGAPDNVAVLGHRLWVSHFGSDRSIVGKTIVLDGQPRTVIGILPPGSPWLDAAEVFVPLVRTPELNRGSFELAVVARLAPGVSIEAARTDLNGLARRIAAQYPEAKGMGITLGPSADWLADPTLRRAIWTLFAAVGFFLLIACVNLANLMLARATGRTREQAVRAALGASRARIARLALTESAILGLLGAALGLAIAFVVVRVMRSLDPGGIPRLAEASVDGWVLAVAIGSGVLTAVISGLVPALRAQHSDLASALREGERSVAGGRRSGRLRASLVGIEVALSLVLLVGAGLLVRSFGRLLSVDRGFHSEHRTIFTVGFPEPKTEADVVRSSGMVAAYMARIRAVPQVTSAAIVSMRPLRGAGTGMGFAASDKPAPMGDAVPWASWRRISSDYFKTMGVPLVRGRDFTDRDVMAAPYRVIISQRIADELWPGELAVGRMLNLWQGQGGSKAEVIGVVANMRDHGLEEGPTYAVYLPFVGGLPPVNIVVNSTAPLATLVPRLRSTLAEIDATLPLSNPMTMDELVGRDVASRRFTMTLLATLAAVARVLVLAGIYGMLSYYVSRRRSEIGIRVALGASRASVLRLVFSRGMRPVAIGLLAGVAGAAALSRFMTSLLFGVAPADAPAFRAGAVLLASAAAISCYLPARGALGVDVVAALREE